jgi:hypothetical protein
LTNKTIYSSVCVEPVCCSYYSKFCLLRTYLSQSMHLQPSLFLAVCSLAFSSLLHGSRAGTLTSVSLSWSRAEPETDLLAISFVLRGTWLASTMSSSLEQGSTFTDGFFCPIDGQVPKCVVAQLLVVSKHSSQLFTEFRTLHTYARCHFTFHTFTNNAFF